MGLSFEQIKSAYEHEAAAASKVYTKDQIPMSWDLITPEWLTDILVAPASAARVTSHRLDQKDEGTASRRRLFLEYNDAGRQPACRLRCLASRPSTLKIASLSA